MTWFLRPDAPGWFAPLRADVEREFAVTGAATPGWPDPHPDRDPAEEEYSRCEDPGRYRILDTRVEAWIRALDGRGLARVTEVGHDRWLDDEGSPVTREGVRRVVPARLGGLALLLVTTEVDGEPVGLDLGLSAPDRPTVLLAMLPDCGCDACDSGSADLLEELDGWFLTVARGGVVHARTRRENITRTVDGWQGTGSPRESWLDVTVPAPRGVRRWVGDAWL